ncbi:NAD(P)H-binding protein [Vibrio lamellibrachiae]|uniref:NAD(P)H-binding protein n=1 Tax=Vibrio lamellibrachiae TaxID=2910253 RepID=UPI003D14FDA8
MENKKLLILGGSGGCGKWAVKIAQERGFQVRVLIRPETRYSAPEGVEVLRGEVLDKDALDNAMKGQDAVISCLGIKRKSPANPWSKVVSPSNLAQSSGKNIVDSMKKHQVNRIVVVSAAGVGNSFDRVSPLMRLIIRNSNVQITFNDFDNMEQILAKSNIDSLAVRPVGLVDKQQNKSASLVNRFTIGSQISKRDVATWMLDAIERPDPFTTKTEMIGWS